MSFLSGLGTYFGWGASATPPKVAGAPGSIAVLASAALSGEAFGKLEISRGLTGSYVAVNLEGAQPRSRLCMLQEGSDDSPHGVVPPSMWDRLKDPTAPSKAATRVEYDKMFSSLGSKEFTEPGMVEGFLADPKFLAVGEETAKIDGADSVKIRKQTAKDLNRQTLVIDGEVVVDYMQKDKQMPALYGACCTKLGNDVVLTGNVLLLCQQGVLAKSTYFLNQYFANPGLFLTTTEPEHFKFSITAKGADPILVVHESPYKVISKDKTEFQVMVKVEMSIPRASLLDGTGKGGIYKVTLTPVVSK